jgi:hypothetical protein
LAEVAILTAPLNIKVLSVDGRSMPGYLLSGISTDYSLLPGEHLVEFQYESVWGIPKTDKDSAPSKAVQSEPRQVRFVSEPGQRLTFRFEEPGNVRTAEAMVDTFAADVVDQAGSVLARSVEAGTYSVAGPASVMSAAALAGQQESTVPVIIEASGSDSGISRIDAMKVLWSRLNAEEKKAFLDWAFE